MTDRQRIETEDGRLDAAVREGIITQDQAMAIRALAPAVGRPPREIDRPPQRTMLQASGIAYTIGAITVIAAMLWFLADRWDSFGPLVSLGVCAVYASLFLVAAHVFRREGQPGASGLAVTLAVIMAGPAAVAFNQLTGLVPSLRGGDTCTYPRFGLWQCRGEELLTELALLAAASLALWRTRYPLLVGIITAVAVRAVFHLTDGWYHNALLDEGSAWVWMLAGSLALSTAYVVERRQPRETDYAVFVHLAAAFCALVATLNLVSAHEWMRHLMVPTAFVAFAAALLLRRFVYVPLGMLWVVWYLGWLARDVFRESPAFPLLLAALGLAVIVATVWIQRNAQQLTARFGGVTDDGLPRFPGGVALLLAPALVALLRLPDGIAADRETREQRAWEVRRFQMMEQRKRGKPPAAAERTNNRASPDP
jgi:hypothetical protein